MHLLVGCRLVSYTPNAYSKSYESIAMVVLVIYLLLQHKAAFHRFVLKHDDTDQSNLP